MAYLETIMGSMFMGLFAIIFGMILGYGLAVGARDNAIKRCIDMNMMIADCAKIQGWEP